MDCLPEIVLNEFLGEVFQYLDFKDLKSASLVCKTWLNVFNTHHKLMAKLPLVLGDPTEIRAAADLAELKRKSTRFVLFYSLLIPEEIENLKRIIDKHGKSFRELEMINCMIFSDESHHIDNIAEKLPVLEKISLSYTKIQTRNENYLSFFNDLVNIPHLKVICHRGRDRDEDPEPPFASMDRLYKPFTIESKVECLKMTDSSIEVDEKFFPLLENLAVQGLCLSVQQVLPCQLKKLSYNNYSNSLNLRTLTSLQFLELGVFSTKDNLQDAFKYLTSLQLFKYCPPSDFMDLDTNLVSNPSIKTFIIESGSAQPNEVFLNLLFRNLPSIETLVLNLPRSTSIGVELSKLRVLELSCLSPLPEYSNLPSLRELYIHKVSQSERSFQLIVESFPTLQKLTIEIFDSSPLPEEGYDAGDPSNHFDRLTNLKDLFLGENLVATKAMFDELAQHSQLQNLTIMKNAIKEDPSMVEEFTKSGKQLELLDKFMAQRNDWSLWEKGEKLEPESDESDLESEPFEDMGIDDSTDEDYDEDVMAGHYSEDESNSDEEFVGNFRPG